MGVFTQAVAALALYFATRAIYNLKFHPLSKYPGPTSWIMFRIPYLICLNTGQLPFRIKELHDRYGPIVRVSADELSFNDSRAWKDISNRKGMLRPPQWGARPPGVEAHNVITAGAADHARFRKALTPAYSERSGKDYEPVVRFNLDKLIVRLNALIDSGGDATNSAVVDIVEWANYATFDIIGELSWAKSYDCLENGTGHAFMGVLLHFQAALIGASISYYAWLNAALMKITPKSAFLMLENIFKDFHERLLARQKMSTIEHPDLMMHINDYNAKAVPSEKLSEAEIEQNVLAIIVEGSETLTTTFSGAFHYLLAHPRKLDRLTKEIRSAFSSPLQISANAVSKLPYLNAVIDETLRLCPPIPDMLRRQVTRDTPVTIAGRVVPAGTTVSVSCYSMFKSADYFSAPEVFEPERFLVKSGTNSVHDEGSPLAHNDFSAFHPFSLGPHNCLGQPLARLEMRLLLVLFLYSFDVRTPPDVELRAWTEQKIYWTWEKQSLPVQLSRA